jgi:predicted RNase H-like HicB family nuclease
MATEYTAVIKQEGDWWIGWIEEVPGVNCQERTRQELVESLRITLQEAIDFNRQDAIASAGSEYGEIQGRSWNYELLENLVYDPSILFDGFFSTQEALGNEPGDIVWTLQFMANTIRVVEGKVKSEWIKQSP